MIAFLRSMAPVDVVFLASALMSALDFLLWTFWLSLKGGIDEVPAPLIFTEKPSKNVGKILRAALGFMMMFGVSGLALRQLLNANPLWSLLGAMGAGLLLAGVILTNNSDFEEG